MAQASSIQQFTADHRRLIDQAARLACIEDPVAFEADSFQHLLLKKAVRGAILPIDGLFIRDWDPDFRRSYSGLKFGMRLYRIEGIPFVFLKADCSDDSTLSILRCGMIVAKADYAKLYRIACRLSKENGPPSEPPILDATIQGTIWQNTISYLEPANLKRIREYGGRPKRGMLLYGPPGNGKTSACRWLKQECVDRGWQWSMVTAESYQMARQACNPAHAIRELFSVEKYGIVFFDDMDMALRNRDDAPTADDQSIFLNALDGIEVKEGLVFLFATNLSLDRIDPAFRRPGRIDVAISFPKPDESLRRLLIGRWHAAMREQLDISTVVRETEGMSFAEIDELRNLLVMHFVDSNEWNWQRAMNQYRANREEFAPKKRGPLGYYASLNGHN